MIPLHCGLAPYRAADGYICASYQQLNPAGRADATVSFHGDKVDDLRTIDGLDAPEFLRRASARFAEDSAHLCAHEAIPPKGRCVMNPALPLTLTSVAGAIPITEAQALLFLTPAEIAAGEKRFETENFGPWQILSKLRGIACTATWKGGPCSRIQDTLTVVGIRSIDRPRSLGYAMEGKCSLNGRKFRSFTSSQLFELPDKRLINVAIIHICAP